MAAVRGGALSGADAVAIVELWRAAASARLGGAEVDLAAAFQRHYTKFGTGLPPNFCLALTTTHAIAFKFDPRNGAHPRAVGVGQIKGEKGRWQRDAVRVFGTSAGPLAVGLVLSIDGRDIPCRTPRLAINPAAAAMIEALGGELPTR